MSLVRTRPPTRPTVRLRAIPPLDPPFEDEAAIPLWPSGPGQQLALDLSAHSRPTGRVPSSRGSGCASSSRLWDGAASGQASPGSLPSEAMTTASPEAARAAQRYLGICLEIVNGYRPPAQIRPLSSPADAATIIAQLGAAGGRLRPPRPAAGRVQTSVRLRRMRASEPCPGVIEAAAVLGAGTRTWAMAFRLERRRGSWVGTTIRLL